MKRFWPYMLFGTLVVVSGSLIAVGQQGPPAAENPTPEVSVLLGMTEDGKIAGEKSVAVARRTTDGTKIVSFLRGTGDPIEGYVVAEDDVMNITAISRMTRKEVRRGRCCSLPALNRRGSLSAVMPQRH